MLRGFISGVFWGLVFTAMSLWIMTQLSDVVRLLVAPNQITENAPDGAGITPDVQQDASNAPDGQGDPSPQLGLDSTSLTTAALDPAPNPDVSTPAAPRVEADQSQVVETPAAPDAGDVAVAETDAPRAGEAAAQPAAPASDATPSVTDAPAQPEPPALSDDAQDNTSTEENVDFSAPQVVELTDEGQEALDQAEEAPAQAAVESETAQAEGQAPEPGPKSNVTTNRLPSIGDDTAEEPGEAQTAEAEPQDAFDENTPALVRFAREFENPGNLPLMAIVLLTDQNGEVTKSTSELPISVSYAFDASLDGADALMAKVRGLGQEVVAIAPLIDRAQPEDVEVAFADYLARVPEAVAVMDVPDGRFQADRKVAAQVIANLAADGRGMITYKRGFNAGLQMAERDGLPAAMVFRDFDGAGQDRAAISRFLDQAAFRAGQQSGVVMIGRDTPETVAAIVEWSLGTRANTVQLAPVSAVLQNK